MAEATRDRESARWVDLLAEATVDAGMVLQVGGVAHFNEVEAVSTGQYATALRSIGKASVEKTTSQVFLPGQEIYWDHSANKAHYAKVNDRDFFLGLCCKQADSADTRVVVDFNRRQQFDIDLQRDYFATTVVGTQGLNTMGVFPRGGGYEFILSATNEAQKVDLLSRDGFIPTTSNMIVEAMFTISSGGAAAEPDFNIGLATGTHATDFDSVTNYLSCHVDGNDTSVLIQSKDNTTTVAATDTTNSYTAGSTVAVREHWLFDCRTPADIQVYRNGVLQLGASTFRLDDGTNPMFLIAHLEKTSSTTVFQCSIERLRCWYSEQ